MAATPVTKHFTSSILLWMRDDLPRQAGMDRWRGPHSAIIAATPQQLEYRQIHLAEVNPGRWPETADVETVIPLDRKIDGVAEVTFESALSTLAGRKQTALAFEDEVNIFRRTLLYAGLPGSSRWYDVASSSTVGSRALLYLTRRDGVSIAAFHSFIKNDLVPALIGTESLRELRTQMFLPWSEKLWDTPHVAHDNPAEHHFAASIILGFDDDTARDAFYATVAVALSDVVSPLASAVHAYDVEAALTYVRNSTILEHYEQ